MKWIGQHIYDLVSRFRADIYIEKGLRDKDGDIGTSGQILSSTGTQTNWINAPSVGTLQEVTDNGNTTSQPIRLLNATNLNSKFESNTNLYLNADYDSNSGDAYRNIIFENRGSEKMRLTSGGNLLLGTTTGSEKLVVAGNIQVNGSSDSSDGLHLKDRTYVAFSDAGSVVSRFRSSSTGVFQFQDGSYNTGVQLRTNGDSYINGGNLGVGTSSPSVPLEVYSSGTDKLKLTDDDGSNVIFGIGGNLFSQDLSASAQYRIRINNSEKIRLDSAGNLGINTSFPSEKLHVVGDVKIEGANPYITLTDTTNPNYCEIKNIDGNLDLQADKGGDFGNSRIRFKLDGTEKMTLSNTGLGIGTTSPDSLLEISSSSTSDFLKLTTAGGGATPIKLVFEKSSVEQGVIEYNRNGDLEIYNTDNDGGVMIDGSASAGGDFYVAHNGNVGIGTSSPTRPLHVVNTSSQTVAIFDGGNNSAGEIAFSSAGTSGGTYVTIGAVANDMSFSAGATEKMRLTSGGNLGVGTSSPVSNYRTHILGVGRPILLDSSNAVSITKISNSSTGNGSYNGLDLVVNSTTSNIIKSYGMPLSFSTSDTNGVDATEKMRLTSGGNLGIGTSSPNALLDVNGEIRASLYRDNDNTAYYLNPSGSTSANLAGAVTLGGSITGTTATFSGQVSAGTHFKLQSGGKLYSNASNVTLQSASGSYLGFNISTAEKMRLTSGGSLLLGTTTGSAKLTVDETTTNNLTVAHFKHNQGAVISDILLENSAGANNTGFNINFKLASSGASAKIGAIRTNSPGAGDTDMVFSTSTNGSSVNEAMRITHDSNVLIGTTTDSGSKLTVEGNSFINSGSLKITNSSVTNYYQSTKMNSYGTVYDWEFAGSKVMRIKSNGNVIIGTTTDSGHKLQVNGDIQIGDGDMLRLGDSSDLKLYHTGTGTVIQNAVGNLTIQQDQNAGDILFRCDDGSGGTALYFALDGSATNMKAYKNVRFTDNVQAQFGDNGDFTIYHDGSNSYLEKINAGTGNVVIQNSNDGADIIFKSDNGTGGITTYLELDGSQTTVNVHKNLLIGTTTNSGVYKLDVAGKARVQSIFELDDVLTLNQISTPADPASGKSSIYMDSSDGAIKVKINVGGTVVTRTLASFEG